MPSDVSVKPITPGSEIKQDSFGGSAMDFLDNMQNGGNVPEDVAPEENEGEGFNESLEEGDDVESEEDETEELPEGEEQEEVPEAPSYKFKADGKEFDVALTPDDPNTQALLKWGAIGKRLMSERDKARDDAKSRDKEIKSLKAELADKQAITELKEAGFIDRAIMRAIGADEYKAWWDKAYQERLEREANGESAESARLRELEDSKRFVEYESSKERKRIEEEREARLIADETARIDSTSQQMFAKYNFSKLGVKPELAERYNQRLFNDARNALQEIAESLPKGEPITAQHIEQAFRSSRQELAALIGIAAEKKATQQVDKMKAAAKTKASTIAKSGGVNGKRPHEKIVEEAKANKLSAAEMWNKLMGKG